MGEERNLSPPVRARGILEVQLPFDETPCPYKKNTPHGYAGCLVFFTLL